MENNEQVSGSEGKSTIQKGSIRPNPTRYNRTNIGGRSAEDASEDTIETTDFDSGFTEDESGSGQSDREEDDISHAGAGDPTTKQSSHSPHPDISAAKSLDPRAAEPRAAAPGYTNRDAVKEANRDKSADEILAEGSNNRGSSGGAGGAQQGRGANTIGSDGSSDGGRDPKVREAQRENLLGQGGYGSSGMSGTNSDLYQSSQEAQRIVGSPDSSTGSNATNKDVNKGVEINHRP